MVSPTRYDRPCVMDVNGKSLGPPCPRSLGRYEHLSYGCCIDETLINRDNANESAPKLGAIAMSVATHNLRTVILIHRENGCMALLRLLRQHGLSPLFLDRVVGDNAAAAHRREQENRDILQQFNGASRRTDSTNRVLVAVAEQHWANFQE
jgi:hypothetical protein